MSDAGTTDLGILPGRSRATPPLGEDACGGWTPSPTSPGWSVRALLETPGMSTQLMRVEPGTITRLHAHDRIEQVYVLSGCMTDDDGTEHVAGSFIVRDAGALHGGVSRDGATLLVVYSDAA